MVCLTCLDCHALNCPTKDRSSASVLLFNLSTNASEKSFLCLSQPPFFFLQEAEAELQAADPPPLLVVGVRLVRHRGPAHAAAAAAAAATHLQAGVLAAVQDCDAVGGGGGGGGGRRRGGDAVLVVRRVSGAEGVVAQRRRALKGTPSALVYGLITHSGMYVHCAILKIMTIPLSVLHKF